MLSSSSSRRGGMKYSMAARSFPSGLRIGVTAIGQSCVGAIIRKPSGSRCRRPRRTTNVRRTVRIGLHELARQPQPLAQIEPPGHRGNEIVGALLDLETVAMHGRNNAAQPRTSLKKRYLALGASSRNRCAAASPEIPPPITAIRRVSGKHIETGPMSLCESCQPDYFTQSQPFLPVEFSRTTAATTARENFKNFVLARPKVSVTLSPNEAAAADRDPAGSCRAIRTPDRVSRFSRPSIRGSG